MADKVSNLVRWASDLGMKHNVNTTTILVEFRRLNREYSDVEKAKKKIEEAYAN